MKFKQYAFCCIYLINYSDLLRSLHNLLCCVYLFVQHVRCVQSNSDNELVQADVNRI